MLICTKQSEFSRNAAEVYYYRPTHSFNYETRIFVQKIRPLVRRPVRLFDSQSGINYFHVLRAEKVEIRLFDQ